MDPEGFWLKQKTTSMWGYETSLFRTVLVKRPHSSLDYIEDDLTLASIFMDAVTAFTSAIK